MKNRVSNAPVSLTRRYEAHLQSKRRGQALLLAVVVMLFVALISAGFLATVSGNLNQTARTSEKNSAIEAAKAGMAFINNRINTSAEGENWRPNLPATIPGDYYNQLAVAQSLVTTPPTYVKYPEGNSVSADAPKFYAKVERIGYSAATRATLQQIGEDSRAGMLKITVFGLAKNDPYAFHKMVAYRGGYDAAPVGRVMRSVSNYDFTNKVVPYAYIKTPSTGALTTLIVNGGKGNFPFIGPFTVTIAELDQNLAITPATVSTSSYNSALNEWTFTLASSITLPTYTGTPKFRVDLAANLGAPTTIDYDRDAATTPTSETLSLSTATNTAPTSARVNGSVWWQGNLNMRGLVSKNDAYGATTTAPRTIESSGIMLVNGTITGNDKASPATDRPIVSSNTLNFPLPSSTDTDANKDQLISDGKSRLLGDLTPTRQTKQFSPPDLTSEANLARYRGLTRDSKPAATSDPADAGSYGYGEGIYISNSSDREKIYDAGLAKNREMTQGELMQMWYSTGAFTAGRLGTPKDRYLQTDADASSLEEQHVRGWVGKDEFEARGALLEIDPVAKTVSVTLEKRGDGFTNNLGPVEAKAWHSATGTIETGVYRKVLNWPKNGVIFAEGNIRIKGGVNDPEVADAAVDPGNSLTVVSLGNIYIEGSLNAGGITANRKVLLLARKNVLVNPTRVIGRVDAQTVANTTLNSFVVSAPADPPITLPVRDTSEFRIGDVVEVQDAGRAVIVSPITATNLSLKVLSSTFTAAVVNPAVRTATENYDSTTGKTLIAVKGQAIQRRVNLPATAIPAGTRLVFDHKAEIRPGMTIQAVAVTPKSLPPTSDPIWLSNKLLLGTKQLQSNYTIPAPAGADLFPGAALLTDAAADAYLIQNLVTDTSGPSGPSHSDVTYEWKYTSAALGNYATIPAHYLARIGLLTPIAEDVIGDKRKNIRGTSYDIPVATSILPTLNGSTINLTDTFGTATQFGFAPKWTDLTEDTLTSDRTFYEATSNFLDSRSFASTGFNGTVDNLVLRQNDDLVGFSTTSPLPAYQVSGLKLENIDATTGNIQPAATFDIRAFVYAQEGSWLVIAGDYFNIANIKGDGTKTYYDFDNSGTPDIGEYVDNDGSVTSDADTTNDFSTGDSADLNMDGIKNVGESANIADFVARFARYNYKINFVGTIAENRTAIVQDPTTTDKLGSVADWMDKWSSLNTTAGVQTWTPISYRFDPAYVTGQLDTDIGFRMPVANDITYQE